jgi:hypothetical protein
LDALVKQLVREFKGTRQYEVGTSTSVGPAYEIGALSIKNLTTSYFLQLKNFQTVISEVISKFNANPVLPVPRVIVIQ